jgi:gluconolactonase
MRALCSRLLWLGLAGISACSSDTPAQGAGRAIASGSGGADAAVSTAGTGGTGGAGNSGLDMPQGDVNLAGASPGGENAGGTAGDQGVEVVDAGDPPSLRGSCPAGPFAVSPLPAGATPVAVCTGLTFAEGPVWFQDTETLYLSDFSIGNAASNFNGRILSYTPGGACQEFIANAGTNGLAIAPDGNLLGCRHVDQTLTIFDRVTRQPTVLVADNAGAAFNSPNDVAVRSDGNLYFTDPNFLIANRTSEQPTRAYRRDPSGVLSVIDEGGNTNGITLSPDETRLYVSHLGGPNNVIVFDVDAAGAATNPQPFIGVGSDGMAIDCAGNLYITQGGVRVYDPEGELIGTLAATGAANVAFGGPEQRTLYITATSTLFAVELAIPGLPY